MGIHRGIYYNLRRQSDLFGRILSLLEVETAALKSVDRPAMEKIAVQKQNLIEQLEETKDELRLLCGFLSLQQIIADLRKDLSLASVTEEIDELWKQIQVAAVKAKELTNRNGILIRQALGVVTTALTLLTSSSSERPVCYGNNAAINFRQVNFAAERTAFAQSA